MAESMAVQTLSYIADVLKFVAVPFALMEVVGPEHRKAIEEVIRTRTKSTCWFALWLAVPTFIGLHFLAFSASHLVLVFFVVILLLFIVQLLVLVSGKAEVAIVIGWFSSGVGFLILLGAVVSWLLPSSWLIGVFYPVEWGLALLRSVNSIWAVLVPAFDARTLISGYRESVAATQAYIVSFGWLFKYSTYTYFLVSDGLVVVVLLCLEATFLLFVLATAGFLLLAPAALFVMFSEQLKRRFDTTDKGVLPLGALVIWAIGETLNMNVSTYKYFWTAG